MGDAILLYLLRSSQNYTFLNVNPNTYRKIPAIALSERKKSDPSLDEPDSI
ncbi:hypothetical protein ADIS_3063 [Lunatimonas lonarensis]|uniref:Uncharacterized protein n=1 Tax=Lunatimonas lonarensis TaxID=1232681 RepID=R7ZRE9_9BACT|nr:hypothetical protein ADIS_3063 [Lunatimonas lonarensis]